MSRNRYVVLAFNAGKCASCTPTSILEEWIRALYGAWGASVIRLREVYSNNKGVYVYRINADSQKLFRSIFVLDADGVFYVIKTTGSLRKARSIADSINISFEDTHE
ncbi:hypothetical protein [Thermofilum pendens]|uniref:Uncharacterized protein n=1 Tax=Thermofilum pendens (strain DSM 2475 / Hrk 5) TaxID=368408 RepID=A1RX66_THEPD|nr:hypothetical protein [Thermofilum pendens]ABL77796.1 hypothetical protein Tpen_0387 [Thermofilum pendens Hrk 5]